MQDSSELLARAYAPATQLLRRRFGPIVRLGQPRLIKDATRAVVARATLDGAASAPASVIIKLIRDDPATGFSEWASLAFLAELPAAHDAAPLFLGGDADQAIYLMQDLGPGRSLHDLLTEGPRAEAEAALGRLAETMARLHAASLGQEERFLQVRQALPAAEQIGRQQEAERWLAGRGRIEAWLEAVDCPAPAGLQACLERIAADYAEPGAWLSFSHGDPAPSNNHFADAQARLVDFEYGAFRHTLYDLSAWEMLCPLPRPAVQLMRRAFQTALAPSLPVAADQDAFERAWATICAFRGLAMLTWVAPALLEADRPMAPGWSAREAVLAAVSRTAEVTADVADLAPVAAAADRLQAALRARWPEIANRGEIATRWAALEDGA